MPDTPPTTPSTATAARKRRLGSTALLLGSLGLAVVAVLLVIGASYLSHAGAASLPAPTPTAPAPAATPRTYLMTEGALQMEMTSLSAGTPSRADLARLQGIVHQAADVELKYRDLAAALANGYQTAPDLLVETQGQHYFQPQYFQVASQGHFDLLHPPFLVYNRFHGKTQLSGLLYYLPASTTRAQMAAIFPPSLAAWHEHVNVCVTGGGSLLTGNAVLPIHDQPTCAAQGGSFTDRTGWMVHLWANEPLGKALFAMDRPHHG